MPSTGPFTRVVDALDARRHRDRRPVEGTSIRLGALLVFLALVVLMVLTASPSMAVSGDADMGAWSGVVNLAPILFWVAVGTGVVTRVVLGRRMASSRDTHQSLARTRAHPTVARSAAVTTEPGDQASAA